MPQRKPDPFPFAAVRQVVAAHVPQHMPPLPGRTNSVHAAVLVPLCWRKPLGVVVTLRAASLREHAGEFSFPGGRRERGDAGLVDTAIRETREELGVDRIDILGPLASIPVYTSEHRLFPFVGRIDSGEIQANKAEVAKVVRLDVMELLCLDKIDGIPFEWKDGTHMSPVFRVNEKPLFGATAHTLYELLSILAPLAKMDVPRLEAGRFQWRDLLGRT